MSHKICYIIINYITSDDYHKVNMTTNQSPSQWDNEKFDRLANLLQETTQLASENSKAIKELREETSEISKISRENLEGLKVLKEESDKQSYKEATYQQSSQQLVNLAFGLIASATIITVVSAVFKR